MTRNHSRGEKRGFEDRLSWIEGQVLNSLSLSFGKKTTKLIFKTAQQCLYINTNKNTVWDGCVEK